MEVETGTYMFMALDKRGEDRAERKTTSLLSKRVLNLNYRQVRDINFWNQNEVYK